MWSAASNGSGLPDSRGSRVTPYNAVVQRKNRPWPIRMKTNRTKDCPDKLLKYLFFPAVVSVSNKLHCLESYRVVRDTLNVLWQHAFFQDEVWFQECMHYLLRTNSTGIPRHKWCFVANLRDAIELWTPMLSTISVNVKYNDAYLVLWPTNAWGCTTFDIFGGCQSKPCCFCLFVVNLVPFSMRMHDDKHVTPKGISKLCMTFYRTGPLPVLAEERLPKGLCVSRPTLFRWRCSWVLTTVLASGLYFPVHPLNVARKIGIDTALGVALIVCPRQLMVSHGIVFVTRVRVVTFNICNSTRLTLNGLTHGRHVFLVNSDRNIKKHNSIADLGDRLCCLQPPQSPSVVFSFRCLCWHQCACSP